ncbi:hypothetical protein ABPG77_011297 [Micractinium sp. CCAP 211/92]
MTTEQDFSIEREVVNEAYEGEAEDAEGESSDSEADRREFGLYQCLPVEPGEPEWDTEEPETVEEYLRRVRYEARQLPDVVTAPSLPPTASSDQHTAADALHSQQAGGSGQQQHVPHMQRRDAAGLHAQLGSSYLAADPGVQDCEPRLKPSSAWTRDFLQQFARLRRRLQREQEMLNNQVGTSRSGGGGGGAAVRLSLLGDAASAVMTAEKLAALQLDPPSDAMPELQQLRGLDQLQVRRQLHSAIHAAVEEETVAPEAAAMLYALSARIEKPLHAGTCALYRQLLRHCAAQRAALGSSGDGAACGPHLAHLNILITIAGAYFGQDEELATMWDDDEE